MSDEATNDQETSDETAPVVGERPAEGDDLEKWKHFSRENEKAAKSAQRELEETRKRLAELEESRQRLAELEDSMKSEQEKALEQAALEAEARVREEYESKIRAAELRSAVMKTAAGKLADPDDALRFLDTDDLDPSDPDAVAGRIDSLLAEKPYLAAAAAPKGPRDPQQGAQGEQEPDISAMSPSEYRKWKRGEGSLPVGKNATF